MPIPGDHLRSIVDHDGAVILDIDHDAMLTLNATGGYTDAEPGYIRRTATMPPDSAMREVWLVTWTVPFGN